MLPCSQVTPSIKSFWGTKSKIHYAGKLVAGVNRVLGMAVRIFHMYEFFEGTLLKPVEV
jgi:hypothetical protein